MEPRIKRVNLPKVSEIEVKKENLGLLAHFLTPRQRDFLYARMASQNDFEACRRLGMLPDKEKSFQRPAQWKRVPYFFAVYEWCMKLKEQEVGLDMWAAMELWKDNLFTSIATMINLSKDAKSESVRYNAAKASIDSFMRIKDKKALDDNEAYAKLLNGKTTTASSSNEYDS